MLKERKQFKARKRSMLFAGHDYWEAWTVIRDLDLDYEEMSTVNGDFHVVTLDLTLPQFMTVEKIFKAKKISYEVFN